MNSIALQVLLGLVFFTAEYSKSVSLYRTATSYSLGDLYDPADYRERNGNLRWMSEWCEIRSRNSVFGVPMERETHGGKVLAVRAKCRIFPLLFVRAFIR